MKPCLQCSGPILPPRTSRSTFCSIPCRSRYGNTVGYRARLKQHVDDCKTSRGCQVCGITAPAYVLDLHHHDPLSKAFNPSKAKSFALANAEFLKCVVLCAVHHRMVENGDLVAATKES